MNTQAVKISAVLPLTTAFAQLHKVYSTRQFIVTMIHIVNTTNAPLMVDLCLVPPGSSAGTTNALLYLYTIPAHDFIEFGEGQLILSSVQVMAKASGAGINIFFTGYEE